MESSCGLVSDLQDRGEDILDLNKGGFRPVSPEGRIEINE